MMRAAKKIGKAMMKLPENKFEDITLQALRQTQLNLSRYPDQVFKNNHYIVQIYKRERTFFGKVMDKMMIRRNDEEPIREWHAIQRIKSQILGDEAIAIQVFPKESELVDVANLYWLFYESKITSTGGRGDEPNKT